MTRGGRGRAQLLRTARRADATGRGAATISSAQARRESLTHVRYTGGRANELDVERASGAPEGHRSHGTAARGGGAAVDVPARGAARASDRGRSMQELAPVEIRPYARALADRRHRGAAAPSSRCAGRRAAAWRRPRRGSVSPPRICSRGSASVASSVSSPAMSGSCSAPAGAMTRARGR